MRHTVVIRLSAEAQVVLHKLSSQQLHRTFARISVRFARVRRLISDIQCSAGSASYTSCKQGWKTPSTCNTPLTSLCCGMEAAHSRSQKTREYTGAAVLAAN